MSRPRTYGAGITISLTPANKRGLRAMARKDGVALPELFAAMIKLERHRRAGAVRILIVDRVAYESEK